MGNANNQEVSSWQLAELKLEQRRKERIEAEQTLEILRNITDKTRLELAKTELQTALARLAMIKEMKDGTQPQEIPETTAKTTEFQTAAEEVPPAPAKQEEPKEKKRKEAKADIAPPTANSESMDAPKETPQTPAANNGSTGNQA